MRIILTGLGVAAALLLGGVAQAGERGGHGGGHGGEGRPPAPCCAPPGGGSVNINTNVNVSARAEAHARASAYGSAVGGARAWSSGVLERHAVGGGVVYVGGGGYAADYGAVGSGAVYHEVDSRGLAGPSAPFGYVVYGFGRNYPVGGYGGYGERRGDRYSDRRDDRAYGYGYEDRRRGGHAYQYEAEYEARYSREESWYGEATVETWRDERREDRQGDWREHERVEAYRRGYADGRADCDCGPPPRPYEPRHDTSRPYDGPGYNGDLPPPGYVSPQAPPRPSSGGYPYLQEPGERG